MNPFNRREFLKRGAAATVLPLLRVAACWIFFWRNCSCHF